MTVEIEFVSPILGFEAERRFRLVPLEPSETLWSLESTATPGLRFVLAAPEAFFPDYADEVGRAARAALADDPADYQVFVILTVSGPLATATANLLAPLALAPAAGRGMQLVLADDALPLAAPLTR